MLYSLSSWGVLVRLPLGYEFPIIRYYITLIYSSWCLCTLQFLHIVNECIICFSIAGRQIPDSCYAKKNRFISLSVPTGFSPEALALKEQQRGRDYRMTASHPVASRKLREKERRGHKNIPLQIMVPVTHFQPGLTSKQDIQLLSSSVDSAIVICHFPKAPSMNRQSLGGIF